MQLSLGMTPYQLPSRGHKEVVQDCLQGSLLTDHCLTPLCCQIAGPASGLQTLFVRRRYPVPLGSRRFSPISASSFPNICTCLKVKGRHSFPHMELGTEMPRTHVAPYGVLFLQWPPYLFLLSFYSPAFGLKLAEQILSFFTMWYTGI